MRRRAPPTRWRSRDDLGRSAVIAEIIAEIVVEIFVEVVVSGRRRRGWKGRWWRSRCRGRRGGRRTCRRRRALRWRSRERGRRAGRGRDRCRRLLDLDHRYLTALGTRERARERDRAHGQPHRHRGAYQHSPRSHPGRHPRLAALQPDKTGMRILLSSRFGLPRQSLASTPRMHPAFAFPTAPPVPTGTRWSTFHETDPTWAARVPFRPGLLARPGGGGRGCRRGARGRDVGTARGGWRTRARRPGIRRVSRWSRRRCRCWRGGRGARGGR